MCGVVGFLNLDGAPADPAVVAQMAATLSHRGPDDSGIYVEGPLALGHRRLSIIDLSAAGQQPMRTQGGNLVISYNGEVYNFAELRNELVADGYVFRSRTDTEVILNAWDRWGDASITRFNGMFAFSLWDARLRQLTIVRDRYGIKPMYWARIGKVFIFGSEVKALLAHPALSARMDEAALVEYLTFQNFFTDRTLFDDVRLLPAGTTMCVSWEGEPRTKRYWDWEFREPETFLSEDESVEELDRLFQRAVQRQLVSDVDVGGYLSGGMDSGSITAIAARSLPFMRSFTVGFDLRSASGLELGMDERGAAEHMSYLFKTEHYEMVLKAGDMERALPRMTYHLEEPRVGQSYPNFYASQLASKFGKVVLSGAGGDEMFGGYPWRYYRALVNDDFEHYVQKYYAYWQRLVPDDLMDAFVAPIRSTARQVSTQDIFRKVFAAQASDLRRPEDYINHSLYFEAKTFLHGLLVVEDKLSMAHGLEVRVPFLDNDLVDFAMRLPARMRLANLSETVRFNENDPGYKTQRYFQRTRDGKLLLRKAMQRYVPIEISEGEKRGFSAPDASWFRGDSMDYVRRMLLESDAMIYQFVDRATALRLVDDHLQGRENRRLLIWSLLSLEHWCRVFLAGEGTEKVLAQHPMRAEIVTSDAFATARPQ